MLPTTSIIRVCLPALIEVTIKLLLYYLYKGLIALFLCLIFPFCSILFSWILPFGVLFCSGGLLSIIYLYVAFVQILICIILSMVLGIIFLHSTFILLICSYSIFLLYSSVYSSFRSTVFVVVFCYATNRTVFV